MTYFPSHFTTYNNSFNFFVCGRVCENIVSVGKEIEIELPSLSSFSPLESWLSEGARHTNKQFPERVYMFLFLAKNFLK